MFVRQIVVEDKNKQQQRQIQIQGFFAALRMTDIFCQSGGRAKICCGYDLLLLPPAAVDIEHSVDEDEGVVGGGQSSLGGG